VAVASAIGLLVYEPRRRDPLLELRFFRSVPFTGATVSAVIGFCAYGSFSSSTRSTCRTCGLLALQAGLCTLPWRY